MIERPRLDPSVPLSLVLGGGGVRGLAHVGALETVLASGFRVAEIVGTSAGALVAAYYAAVGADPDEILAVGLGVTTRHLLAWSWLRRAPDPVYRRFRHRAGPVATVVERLARASWDRLHHGVERLGLVAYDRAAREIVVGHSAQTLLTVEDAARGAAAVPGLFPARRVRADGRELVLCDGGVRNMLPVDVLFTAPFRPRQALVVDLSNTARERERHIGKVYETRAAHADVPVVLATPATIGRPSLVYRRASLASLVDEGRRAVDYALASSAGAAPSGT